jgi:hypothetical protein
MYSYHFEVIDQQEYLHVTVSGSHETSSISYDYMLRMMKSAREHNKRIIFLEEDFPDHPGIMEVYQNFVKLINHLEDFTVVLFDHQSKQYERNKFVESAANDLGIRYYVCKTKKEAVQRVKFLGKHQCR